MCIQETLRQLVSGLYMLPSWCTALSGREQVLVVRHTASGSCFKSLPACKNSPSPSSPIPRLEVILFLRHSSGASCCPVFHEWLGLLDARTALRAGQPLHLLHVPLVLCIKKLHIRATRGEHGSLLVWLPRPGPDWTRSELAALFPPPPATALTAHQGAGLFSLILDRLLWQIFAITS